MNDHELERILQVIGAEEHRPAPELLLATRSRLHRPRMLRPALFASLASCWLIGLTVVALLLRPDLSIELKSWLSLTTCAAAGGACLLSVATRRGLAAFFQRLEVQVR